MDDRSGDIPFLRRSRRCIVGFATRSWRRRSAPPSRRCRTCMPTTRATRSTPSTRWPKTCWWRRLTAPSRASMAPWCWSPRDCRRPRRAAARRVGGRRPLDDHRGSDRRHARADVPEAARVDSHRRRRHANPPNRTNPTNPTNPTQPDQPVLSHIVLAAADRDSAGQAASVRRAVGRGGAGRARHPREPPDRGTASHWPFAPPGRRRWPTGLRPSRGSSPECAPSSPRSTTRSPRRCWARRSRERRSCSRTSTSRAAASSTSSSSATIGSSPTCARSPAHSSTRPFVTSSLPLCCHPYDLCTELIARECGVVVTDERGAPLDAPLNVEADVSWVGYANAGLRDRSSRCCRRP